jgi:hypothetical protein
VTTPADLTVIGALAATWLAAGLLADTLPDVGTARALLRRTRLLTLLVGLGAALLVAVPFVAAALGGESAAPAAALMPAVPALVVLTVTVRRLGWLRRGAAAFATAPLTPSSPVLRAAAAHPLLVAPLQVTGLAALAGTPVAAGLVQLPRADITGIAVCVVGVAVVAIGARHALRHSRLAEGAVRVRAIFRAS